MQAPVAVPIFHLCVASADKALPRIPPVPVPLTYSLRVRSCSICVGCLSLPFPPASPQHFIVISARYAHATNLVVILPALPPAPTPLAGLSGCDCRSLRGVISVCSGGAVSLGLIANKLSILHECLQASSSFVCQSRS